MSSNVPVAARRKPTVFQFPSSATILRSRKVPSSGGALTMTFLWSFLTGVVCFYGGLMIGSANCSHSSSAAAASDNCWTADDPRIASMITSRVKERLARIGPVKQGQRQVEDEVLKNRGSYASSPGQRFPRETMGSFATGVARVSRDDFASYLDLGVPLDESGLGNNEVLLIYKSHNALPSDELDSRNAVFGDTLTEPPLLEHVPKALENCNQVHLIFTNTVATNQCIAIMGQYESYHVQKYMRLPMKEGNGNAADLSLPLRYVPRGATERGRISPKSPTVFETKDHWAMLAPYLTAMPSVLDLLKPIVGPIAKKRNNAVIVLVCNLGQSELLANFVCNAKSKNLSLESTFVFATDLETLKLATSLGLTAFHDSRIFGNMPKQAARAYADHTFKRIMMAKVYCVQLILMLGHDVLFQDVDVIWYKDPLLYFHDRSNPHRGFDIYFQDDGNHAQFYAPYSANTGFYYVRHSDKTTYFFNSLLQGSGDIILSTKSHQIALIALLNEHASLFGMQVKIFERNTHDFPGGYTFHRRPTQMKEIMAGGPDQEPIIFHMSWTLNKDNKVKFYRQIAQWYLKDQCVAKPVQDIEIAAGSNLVETCCSAEPLFSCHYRDKPSKYPCKNSPTIDKHGRSFW